ncbi:aldehyde dehydrogenase family protein [Lysinibacillus sp. Bpr_S20]|uniref:aldehyde dehydrogenase family protein n=1 Tax=Lysinibacillus sp. Bpr_S20 TaxID=2933964 RepID=UPI0020137BD8|nr:aldehyde dehydrogenase family protein [Lysinibacillus sp. Bpr_S20]MCL1698810.1 aldehyde dehydrogenase family protein [Lysinibacillus sp. Bpr_S20]
MKKYNLFIAGKEVETENYSSLYTPYSKDLIAEIAIANESQVNAAISHASQSFKSFSKFTAHKRFGILEKVSKLLEERKEEAAQIIALELAKPLKYARAEIARTIETYQFAAEEAKRIYGEVIPLDAAQSGENRFGYTKREPLGVIGAITPFNFPFNLVAHKVGPAIAAGNSIVLKPASQTPLSALYIAGLFKEAGLPDGVLNVVTGPGSVIGDLLLAHDEIKMITFTGSPKIGYQISQKAGFKRTTLELGSNSALIIDKDVDVSSIIDRCVMGAFSNQGQVCISTQRIYVHEDVASTFVELFINATNQLKLGDPLAEDTDISALVSPGDLQRSLDWIREAEENGAQIITGGHEENGVLKPTIILDAKDFLKVSCNEVFAPIVVVNTFKEINDAIGAVNNSEFGLQAGIYTNNVPNALLAADNLEVGGVIINDVPTFRVDHMPYGGIKNSGTGREGLKYAIEEMTEMKLIIWNQS